MKKHNKNKTLCKTKLDEARKSVDQIEYLERNSEMYIYDFFNDIKRQVDMRREVLKNKIDECSDDIIKSIESSQATLIKLSKEVTEISINIKRSKNELYRITKEFTSFEFKDFNAIKKSLNFLNKNLTQIITDYNGYSIGNNTYEFIFDDKLGSEIFGNLIVVFIFMIEFISY